MNSTYSIEKTKGIEKKLLKKSDYLLIDSGKSNYVFLAQSLKLFKVNSSHIKNYLDICSNSKLTIDSLCEEEINKIGDLMIKLNDHSQIVYQPSSTKQNLLILNLTNGCNLGCKYCFAKIENKIKKVMSLAIAQKAIQNMLLFNPETDQYSIYFFGGEPMLQKQLVRDITEYAYQQIVVQKQKKVDFLLNTNGTLFTQELFDFFRYYKFTITVSIDGPQYIHDQNRVYLNGKGSFDKVMEGIRHLKEFQVKTNLRATFNSKATNLVEIIDFFEKLKLPYTYSFSLNSSEKSTFNTRFGNDEIYHTDVEMKKMMDYFIEKIKMKQQIYYTGFIYKIAVLRHGLRRQYGCEAGRSTLTVDESGNYFACQNMLPFPETKLGNIHSIINENLKKKYQSKDLTELRSCDECIIRNLCGGGCEAECFFDEQGEERINTQRCRLTFIEWKNILYAYARFIELERNES